MGALLTITADDFGYHPSYDAGIIEAARAGALDSASVLVTGTGSDPSPLVEIGVAVGLHLAPGAGGDGPLTRSAAIAQLDRFERIVGRGPDFLDGHRHCHAAPEVSAAIGAIAAELGVPLRSVDDAHRRLLRSLGVITPDRLIGRYHEAAPALPKELLDARPWVGWSEWMVHPGHADRRAGSSYDRGRAEDLATVLGFEPPPGVRRVDHRGAHAGRRPAGSERD